MKECIMDKLESDIKEVFAQYHAGLISKVEALNALFSPICEARTNYQLKLKEQIQRLEDELREIDI